MSKSDLLLKLRGLHEELSTINDGLQCDETVDEETIDALGQLVTDVSELVDRAKETLHPDEHKDVHDRVLQFQTEHPQIAQFLTQVTDMLAMMGI